MSKSIFITGTDTDVGKTIATYCLGALLQEQGVNVGVMKPVQCSGDDAKFLKRKLKLSDKLSCINPYFSPEPLAPNVAFKRAKKRISISNIKKAYSQLREKYELLLVEGAGGLMVPITDRYLMIDLIEDFECEAIVVSRPGLGAINHTLLTVEALRQRGITVKGVIFSDTSKNKRGIAEQTNPDVIKRLSGVPVLGVIPYLKQMNRKYVIGKCKNAINIDAFKYKRRKIGKNHPWEQWDKEYLWHPFTQMKDWLTEEPLVIDQAKGSYLIDTKGNKYLDGISSLWVNVHGHRERAIDQAVKSQADRLSHSTLLGLSNTPAIELARKLVEITPKGLDKVFYSDNGSTAVEAGLKIAYQYWQNIGKQKKTELVHLANSYHGDTLGSVSVGGIDLFHKVYRKLIFKTIELKWPTHIAAKQREFDQSLKELEALFKSKHDSIAAFVVEPIVQGAAGMYIWPKGILKKMADLSKQYDVIFIVDEVATGFGRTGKMFACEHEGVQPDIMCLAKGITGGYLPLAATLTSQKIFDGFCHDYKDLKTFFHGHTYTGNPLACAAALANLQVFENKRVLSKMTPKTKHLAKGLKLFYNLRSVGEVRQFGFMVGIELVKDHETLEPYDWKEQIGVKICERVRERGVILRPLGNNIILMPPLSMTKKELDKLLEVTYWAIKEETMKNDRIQDQKRITKLFGKIHYDGDYDYKKERKRSSAEQIEASRRLADLGGTEKKLKKIPRRR